MKIAFFSECYYPVVNGVVTSLHALRDTLRETGHTVYLFAPGAPQPQDDEHIFRLPELPFPRHPYHIARPFPRPDIDFHSLGVQIIHCHHPFTVGRLGANLARKHHLPMVYTAHSLYDDMVELSRSSLVRKVGPKAVRSMVRRFCARSEYVVVPSNHTRVALAEDGVAARFVVVPSGVSLSPPSPDARALIRNSLQMPPNAPLMLQVSRLGPEKRVDLLLQAVSLLEKMNLNSPASSFRLAVVGGGQCREELEELRKMLRLENRVLLAGEQPFDTISSWYAAADIFVLSSPEETQGLTIVEAMAAGLPCVAMAHGGPRELVVHGETGLLSPVAPRPLAEDLATLITNPSLRRKMGRKGRRRAALYTPQTMTMRILEVYRSAIARYSASRAL